MKTRIFAAITAGGILAALPLLVGGEQQSIVSPTAADAATNQSSTPLLADTTNAEMAEAELEDASGEIVTTPQASPSGVNLSATTKEIVKLAQGGVDESVMLSYVTNSTYKFALTSDDIIYLNDIGVPASVVTAMLQRDQALGTPGSAIASAPPVYTNQQAPDMGAPTPYPGMENTGGGQPVTTEVVENTAPPAANVSYTYFYNSLSPYGTWINVDGYGPVWQPTAGVGNPGWQPYADRGHWVYSDCGWYWASDYSWGWAPFHYGRWFCHRRWGWCWAPDTVWGPSWVTWRYSGDYCGWAPLPPTACFTPGIGFTFFGRPCGVSFTFGLSASRFCFVPVNRFCDRHVGFHRLPSGEGHRIFRDTIVVNQVSLDNHHRVINHGIPTRHIERAIHTELRPVEIRHSDNLTAARRGDRMEPGGRSLTVYQPDLPKPTQAGRLVGEGVQANPHHRVLPSNDRPANTSVNRREPLNRQDRQDSPVRSPRRPDNVLSGNPGSTPTTLREPLNLNRPERPITSGRDRAINTSPANNPAIGNRGSTFGNSPAPRLDSIPGTPNDPGVNPSPIRRNPHHESTTIAVPQPRPSMPEVSTPRSTWASPVTPRQSESPRFGRSDQNSYVQPSMPAQRPPSVPSYSPPTISENNGSRSSGSRSYSAPSSPSFGPPAASHSAPSAPAPSAPPSSSHSSRSSDQNSGGNSDRGNNAHHRDR